MTVYDCNSNNVVLIPQTGIYFENGTCKCPAAAIGDTEVIGGITYTAVDNTTISHLIGYAFFSAGYAFSTTNL